MAQSQTHSYGISADVDGTWPPGLNNAEPATMNYCDGGKRYPRSHEYTLRSLFIEIRTDDSLLLGDLPLHVPVASLVVVYVHQNLGIESSPRQLPAADHRLSAPLS